MGNPEEARPMAGCSKSNHGLRPYFLLASSRPRTVPGTPAARQPTRLSLVTLPLASRYMSCDALRGAFSRKSINVVQPSTRRISMKPPPPMLPAKGCVTARAKPTATAASTALPPDFRTATPTSAANGSWATTIPLRAYTGSWALAGGVNRQKVNEMDSSFKGSAFFMAATIIEASEAEENVAARGAAGNSDQFQIGRAHV